MTDDDLTWADIRQNISTQFGEPPGPQLENEIINAFQKNPQAVIKAADEVANALHAGEIHSGWPILRKRTERITNPLRNVTVPRPDARAKAISRAEKWMKNAGMHFDTESEVEDELFGDRGMLRDWPDLKPQFLELWKQARPIGQQLEQDLHDRSEHWKATTGVMHNERNRRRLEQAAAQETNHELTTQSITTDVDLPAELQETR